MSTLGSLLGIALTVGIVVNMIGLPWLFWPAFLFCSIIILPFALLSDSRYSARRRQEAREDRRHAQELEAIKEALAAGQQSGYDGNTVNNLNIDARSVHYHQPEEKAQKRLFDKP